MRQLAIVIVVMLALFTLINAYTSETSVPKESTPAEPTEQEARDSLG
ncbi:MAG: hypothetical protein ACLFUM_02285 [Spirochaetaceae bacterium]